MADCGKLYLMIKTVVYQNFKILCCSVMERNLIFNGHIFRMQNIMRYHGAKGNLSTSSTTVEIEDKFDVLIDVNDQILERVVSKMFRCHLCSFID